jgi:hypothetical protein
MSDEANKLNSNRINYVEGSMNSVGGWVGYGYY